MRWLLVAAVVMVVSAAERVRYDNFSVFKVNPETEKHLAILNEMIVADKEYMFWNEPRAVGVPVNIMAPPHKQSELKSLLGHWGLDYKKSIDNVQTLIDKELSTRTGKALAWDGYYSLDEINTWLSSLEQQFPDIVTVLEPAQSYEGRVNKGVKVSFKPGNRAIFLEAGMHSREILCPAAITWVLNQLLTSTDPVIRATAESYDWYVFPVVNPDGYDYMFYVDRFWRKTRAPVSDICYGVDPNRNWPFEWSAGTGTSGDPCSEGYMGTAPFSEVESRTFGAYLQTIAGELDAYLSCHTYTQLLLLPYSYSAYPRPNNFAKMLEIGYKMVDSMGQRYGVNYTAGNTVEIFYAAGGTTMDWVVAELGVPVSYTYELRDLGEYGFMIPPDQIVPQSEEVMDSIVTLVEELKAWLPKKP